MQPINYLSQVADPFAQAVQGVQLGAGMVELQQKQSMLEQQQKQAQLAAQEQARFFANPKPTMRDALQFASVLPKDRADSLRPYIENFSKEQQQGVLKTNGQILSALQINPETGIKLLKNYAAAQRNIGDEQEAALYDRIAEAAADPARGPAMAFKSLASVTAALPGAKEMFEAAEKNFKAQTAGVEAQHAEENALADLKKKADDAGLTKAQTNKALAETSKLGVEAKMLRLDFDAAVKGLPLPSKGEGKGVGSEDERKAAGWLSQATNAYTNMLGAMYTKEGKPTGAEKPGLLEAVPVLGGVLGGSVQSTNRQKFNQASSSLSEALLRAATGAGVNKDEAEQKLKELTPLYTDDEGTKKQKLAAIPMYLDSLKTRAGRAAPKDYQIPSGQSSAFSLTLPTGQTVTFKDQHTLNAFKAKAGL